MAANKRTTKTAFTIKDVFVVVSAMLTAVAPLVANDIRVTNLQTQLTVIQSQAEVTRSDVKILSSEVKGLNADESAHTSMLSEVQREQRQNNSDVAILDTRVDQLEHKKR